MTLKRTLFFGFIFLHAALSYAQSTGNWWMYFGDAKLNERFNFHHEIQYRNYNFVGDLEQLLIRGGLGFNLVEGNHNVLLGYGYIQSEVEGPNRGIPAVIEHRIFQQYTASHALGRVAVLHRARMEERFSNGDTDYRFRYFISGKIPLKGEKIEAHTFYASIYSELFLIPDDTGIFERNRAYAALGYAINKQLKVELGYMNQIFSDRNSPQLQIAVFNRLDFHQRSNPRN